MTAPAHLAIGRRTHVPDHDVLAAWKGWMRGCRELRTCLSGRARPGYVTETMVSSKAPLIAEDALGHAVIGHLVCEKEQFIERDRQYSCVLVETVIVPEDLHRITETVLIAEPSEMRASPFSTCLAPQTSRGLRFLDPFHMMRSFRHLLSILVACDNQLHFFCMNRNELIAHFEEDPIPRDGAVSARFSSGILTPGSSQCSIFSARMGCG